MFANKTLMITGGTGSFGNAVLKRFLDTDISEIRIFSRDEKKQEDMRIAFNNPKLRFYIGDVRDYDSVRQAMHGVDYVFHAAALKQVPSCEFYPMEAVQTNIIGAENVMAAAIHEGVERVIVLSTDKAVYPINAMGLSKAMMEKLMVAKSRMRREGETILCATRYGNVMASRGSVIPLFVSQIMEGKPLTITDPEMTRFLMSLDDSVDLVLYAFTHGKQGDIFVQKAPASTIQHLAEALKDLFNANNEIKAIGTRHGEKLYESLVSREELARAEDLGGYYRIPADARDLNYAKFFVEGEAKISTFEDYTSHNTERLGREGVKSLLLKLDFIREQLDA
ncbi:UDP-glucose 4-epimerase [Burkholderia stagnalis]|uniref:polysaccharide biosynthesis protein n=1 Tax=Burkholderia stagnalis TaxID=1503054 RepID=UPI000760047C|nr:polysaccharide biosynthesis protein [Burkholderia stagnalis]KWK52846.1 UDP-glucose 4-epimerase [Burkholderia stagnalis]KWK60568.1 UDP-glucose 4-epimerase [Burkholderia stagnalis]KWN72429.1 UDP-glucose 4-epimerase [Burkholderia stagnalis]